MNVDPNPGAVTRYMEENLCPRQKIKNYRNFWFPYEIAVVAKYHAKISVHCRGGWLPYKVFRGCQLPSTNYCAIPWWLLTAANVTDMNNRYRGKP